MQFVHLEIIIASTILKDSRQFIFIFLKPQDFFFSVTRPVVYFHFNNFPQVLSFGEFEKNFLDLQKVQEIIRKHHQTPPAIVLNDILSSGKLSLCT